MNDPSDYSALLVDGFLDPTKFGAKHLLFCKTISGGLIQEIINPSNPDLKLWEGGLDRLVSTLMTWHPDIPLWTFGVAEHDCCFAEIIWPHVFEPAIFFARDLVWLQTVGVSDEPVVQVGVTTEQMEWLVLFERRSELEIAFYGPEEKWVDLSTQLSNN